MDNIKLLLGKRIKELRKELRYSQEQLAELIGIEPNNLSRIENGKNYPTPENLSKIASALNVTPDILFSFNHHKNYDEIKKILISILEDEKIGRLLYKFYISLKQ